MTDKLVRLEDVKNILMNEIAWRPRVKKGDEWKAKPDRAIHQAIVDWIESAIKEIESLHPVETLEDVINTIRIDWQDVRVETGVDGYVATAFSDRAESCPGYGGTPLQAALALRDKLSK